MLLLFIVICIYSNLFILILIYCHMRWQFLCGNISFVCLYILGFLPLNVVPLEGVNDISLNILIICIYIISFIFSFCWRLSVKLHFYQVCGHGQSVCVCVCVCACLLPHLFSTCNICCHPITPAECVSLTSLENEPQAHTHTHTRTHKHLCTYIYKHTRIHTYRHTHTNIFRRVPPGCHRQVLRFHFAGT